MIDYWINHKIIDCWLIDKENRSTEVISNMTLQGLRSFEPHGGNIFKYLFNKSAQLRKQTLTFHQINKKLFKLNSFWNLAEILH